MKVLLTETVLKLGHLGEVVDVAPGYARNYLLPQGLAVPPTKNNLKAIESAKQKYLQEMETRRAEMQAKADAIDGKEVTLTARANEEGHLYGSIGPAQIVEALAAQNVFLEPEFVDLGEPIRELDKYDVPIYFRDDITATISVWVVRHAEDGEVPAEGAAEPIEPALPAGEEAAEEEPTESA